MPDSPGRHRVVIVGAGFAGYNAARELSKLAGVSIEITVINSTDYFLYLPLLPQVGTGLVEPRHICVSLLSRMPNVRFVLGTVTDVDARQKVVTWSSPEGGSGQAGYDRLILTAGSVNKLLPIPGVADYAHGFRSIAEAIYLRDHITRQLELAAGAADEAERQARCTFVVVGAGYTGTEVAAQGQLLTTRLAKRMPGLVGEQIRWLLLDTAPRLLPELHEHLSNTAGRVLRRRGVEVRTGQSVATALDDCWVQLSTGEKVATHSLIWCVGVRADPLVTGLDLDTIRGRLVVDEFMSVPGAPDIYACGDCAAVPDLTRPGEICGMTAQHAQRQGKQAARNVAASLGAGKAKPYKHHDLGFLVDLGGLAAAANPLNIPLSGPPANVVTRAYHLIAMAGNRARVLAEWGLNVIVPAEVTSFGVIGPGSVPLDPDQPRSLTKVIGRLPDEKRVHVVRALIPRARAGDTEEVDSQQAEVHLRLLAEEELRRPAWAWGERRARVGRIAQLLTAIGALDDEVAGQILADFDLALAARQGDVPGRRGLAAVSWRPSAAVRIGPARPVSSRSPASGPVPGRLVRLGQVIPLRAEPADGEVYLLSYAQTEAGPQLSLFMRSTRQAGPSGPEARSLEQFTATDDRGIRYQMMVRDLGGGTDGWTLMLSPSPPHDPQWLDLITAPGQPAVRIGLDPSARPPQHATVAAGPVTASAGDHLLHAVAARLLAKAGPDGFPLPEGAPRAGPLAPGAEGFGDVIAALQAAGALSPLSPVPGQFAALCDRLHLTGHGITAPPVRDLPGSWTAMLAHYHHGQAGTAPAADGGAAAAVALPELDGITLAILGLHNCQGRTVVHMHASGPMSQVSYSPAGLYYWPVTWIRDNGGRWHATRILGQSGIGGGTALRVEVVPPLIRATTGIEVVTTGRSAQARAKMPLRWE